MKMRHLVHGFRVFPNGIFRFRGGDTSHITTSSFFPLAVLLFLGKMFRSSIFSSLFINRSAPNGLPVDVTFLIRDSISLSSSLKKSL